MTQSNLAFTDGHEIPKGYKKTEVGVIPNDWNVESLQNLCRSSITYGIVQCGPHIPNGIPYIRVSDMNSSELNVDEMLRTSPEIASSFGRSKVEEGDIVYALRGKLGEVKMVGTEVSGANLTQGTARIAPKNNIDNRYLLWTLRSPQALKQAVKEAKGSTFVEITLGNLKGIGVPLPSSREEQQKIATALSDTDVLISELEKLIEKKQAIKTATMQQLLTGKTRLPEFIMREDGTPKGYKDSELGQIPDDWEEVLLADAVIFLDGLRKPVKASNRSTKQGIYPYYGASGIVDYVDDYIFDDNLILLGEDGENILSRNLPLAFKVSGKVWVNNHAHVMKPKSDFNINYLTEFLESLDYSLLNSGTAQPKLNKKTCMNIKVLKPSLAEQILIGNIIEEMDQDIYLSIKRLNKLKFIKQGMMQELLTGKTRLV
ncbi:restriction endonuclease subunit S [Acinetobacter sp. TY2]|uniref:restriction endonuclease subunit S n=1 Tax=Acinetobacter sp. TY2 TaxID=3387403 RepID=UPI003917B0D6